MYEKLLKLLRRLWHAHALFWGHNETQISAKRKCIVITPHPDDETIAMGVTIARKTTAGTQVALIVATDGRHSQNSQIISKEELVAIRKTELLGAASVLGIDEDDIYFLDEEDGKVNDEKLEAKINDVIDGLSFTAEEILTTSWFDGHQDHQACARIAKNIAKQRNLILRCSPVYWWAQGPSRFHREHHSTFNRQLGKIIDLKRAFFERGWTVDSDEFKVTREHALKHYVSQTTKLTDEQSWSTLDEEWLKQFDRKREYFINQ